MEAVAKLRNVPTSPRKMRLVANLVRGKSVQQALGLLKFEPSQGAARVEQLLLSAIANWGLKNEGERIEDANLFVKTIYVDGGRILKRLRPAPQGRGHRIRKRSNHITLVIDSRPVLTPEDEAAKAAKLQDLIARRKANQRKAKAA